MSAKVIRRCITTATASIVLCTGLPSPAMAEYRCITPQGVAERLACEAARQGPEELRRFVQKTRPAFNLYFYDYAPRDDAWWTASQHRQDIEPERTALTDSPSAEARSGRPAD